MIVNEGYFINDNQSSSFPNIGEPGIINKFDYLSGNPSEFLLYELFYLRINNRVIKRSEYGTGLTTGQPLTSLRVGQGGQPVTFSTSIQPKPGANSVNAGIDNYTNFINNIFRRHGIKSRFYPMGKNYSPTNPNFTKPPLNSSFNATGNLVGCNLSLLEDFCLIFKETPPVPLQQNSTSNIAVHLIETNGNMSLKGLIRTLPAGSFEQREFNTLTSSTRQTQILIDQTSFFTEKRYEPINPTI